MHSLVRLDAADSHWAPLRNRGPRVAAQAQAAPASPNGGARLLRERAASAPRREPAGCVLGPGRESHAGSPAPAVDQSVTGAHRE